MCWFILNGNPIHNKYQRWDGGWEAMRKAGCWWIIGKGGTSHFGCVVGQSWQGLYFSEIVLPFSPKTSFWCFECKTHISCARQQVHFWSRHAARPRMFLEGLGIRVELICYSMDVLHSQTFHVFFLLVPNEHPISNEWKWWHGGWEAIRKADCWWIVGHGRNFITLVVL